MSKGIQLTPTQIKAYENGATMFLFPLIDNYKNSTIKPIFGTWMFPIKNGNKNVLIKNTDYSFSECIDVRVVRVQDISADNKIIKSIGVTEEDAILYNGWKPTYNDPDSGGILAWDIAFEEFYNQQLKEQNINRTYEDNDYVFLVEFRR